MILDTPVPPMLLLLLAVATSPVCGMWCYPTNSDVSGSGSPDVCIGAHDLGTGSTEFTIFASVSGWVGFGVGASSGDVMGPADVFVAYADTSSSSGVSVKSFINYGAGNITENSISVWSQVALNTTIPQPSWAPIAVSVVRYNAATGSNGVAVTVGGTSNFIFAWSSSQVTSSSDGISIPYHQNNHSAVTATIAANSASGIISLPRGLSRTMLTYIHVILMSLSLVAMPSAGIFVAMFLREKLGRKWIGVHLGIMMGGVGILSVGSGILMILFNPGQIMSSIHEVLGVVILGLVLLQIGFGFAAKSSVEGSLSVISRCHKYFGLILAYIIVPVQVALGFVQYAKVFGSMPPIWLIAVPTALFVISVASLATGYFTLPYEDDLGLSYAGNQKVGSGTRRNFVELEENVTDAESSRNGRQPLYDFGSNTPGRNRSQNGHYNTGGMNNTEHGEALGSRTGRIGAKVGGSGNSRAGDDAADGSKDYKAARHAPPRSQNSRGNNYHGSSTNRGADSPGLTSTRGGNDYPVSAPARRAPHGRDYPGSTNGRSRQDFSSSEGAEYAGRDYAGSANGRSRGDGSQTRKPSQTRGQAHSRTRRPYDEF